MFLMIAQKNLAYFLRLYTLELPKSLNSKYTKNQHFHSFLTHTLISQRFSHHTMATYIFSNLALKLGHDASSIAILMYFSHVNYVD